jgi:hypothetical protein
MSKAIEDVVFERARQVTAEGWTREHDDDHDCVQLANAAAAYAALAHRPGVATGVWPFEGCQPKDKGHRQNCVRAAALLLAEIERLDRLPVEATDNP